MEKKRKEKETIKKKKEVPLVVLAVNYGNGELRYILEH